MFVLLLVSGATLARPNDKVPSDDDITDEEFQSYPAGCDGHVISILTDDDDQSLQSPESNTGDATCRWKLAAKQDSVSKINYCNIFGKRSYGILIRIYVCVCVCVCV